MSERQYVAVKFRPAESRTYTYHNDGEPVAIGDMVKVESRHGWQKVTVVDLPTEAPPFPTKAIVAVEDEPGDMLADSSARQQAAP